MRVGSTFEGWWSVVSIVLRWVSLEIIREVGLRPLRLSISSNRRHKTTSYSIVAHPGVAALADKLGDGG